MSVAWYLLATFYLSRCRLSSTLLHACRETVFSALNLGACHYLHIAISIFFLDACHFFFRSEHKYRLIVTTYANWNFSQYDRLNLFSIWTAREVLGIRVKQCLLESVDDTPF